MLREVSLTPCHLLQESPLRLARNGSLRFGREGASGRADASRLPHAQNFPSSEEGEPLKMKFAT